MLARTNAKGASSREYIRARLPYIQTEILIIIVFRAVGYVVDKDTLEDICYDFADTQMTIQHRASVEDAFVIRNQQLNGHANHNAFKVCEVDSGMCEGVNTRSAEYQ
ncbi:RNA polymerase II second largest subunit [Artemisia annua]|uniref:RNA polymerase II second largest subunit n=1 Tax=Artemisia annua TaxID=35608 RepID=A0A2U1MPX8_ARTAN|nr:RNA polymerase II second largest subunit [Artemisia annua]